MRSVRCEGREGRSVERALAVRKHIALIFEEVSRFISLKEAPADVESPLTLIVLKV